MGLIVGFVVAVVVVIGIAVALFGGDRYRSREKGSAAHGVAEPTDEVFIDPATGHQMRVWHDTTTGRREYRRDE